MLKQHEDGDLYVYEIDKSEIVHLKYNRFIAFIKGLEESGSYGFESLFLTINGFDDSPLELFEIDQVRRWFLRLINKVPHFLYFITDYKSLRGIYLACISDIEIIYLGKKESPIEYLESGGDPYNRPTTAVSVSLPKNVKDTIMTGLREFERKTGDSKGVNSIVDFIENFVKN